MSQLRLIARLDIKGPNVVKGISFEGLRVVGDPRVLASRYAEWADELFYLDTVATLYGRNQIGDLLKSTTREVFIPVTVGGGIRTKDDVRSLLCAGADKVAINTAAIRNPALIREIAGSYGSQAIAVSIEAKRTETGWEAYTDNGREKTGRCAVEWAQEAVSQGAGEILLTSIDKDGTMKGMDLDLYKAVGKLPVPTVLCGGVGKVSHVREALDQGVRGIGIGAALHYGRLEYGELVEELGSNGYLDERGGRSAGIYQQRKAA